jgi:hypothetical protein
LTSSLALGAARCRVKCRQRHRRAGNRASKSTIRVPTMCSYWEGNTRVDDKRKACVHEGPGVVLEPSARRETARARTGRPRWYPGANQAGNGPGSQKHDPGMNANEESNMGILLTKLPNKTRGNTGGGGGGGKACDQGEHQGTNTDPTLCGTSLRCTTRSLDVREGAQRGYPEVLIHHHLRCHAS